MSTGKDFIPASHLNKEVEIKANWSRVIKEEGFRATNINVHAKQKQGIDVDPFSTYASRSRTTDNFLAIEDTSESELRNMFFSRKKSFDSSDEDL